MPGTYKYEKVMVVDDSELERKITSRLLQLYGLAKEVVIIGSAPEALQYLRTLEHTPMELPELIFLDLHMPGMSGLEFLNEYYLLPNGTRKKHIIMLTSSELETDRTQALENPYVLYFLNKPLDPTVIQNL